MHTYCIHIVQAMYTYCIHKKYILYIMYPILPNCNAYTLYISINSLASLSIHRIDQ